MRCLRGGALLKEMHGCCAIGVSARGGRPVRNYWWCAYSCETPTGGARATGGDLPVWNCAGQDAARVALALWRRELRADFECLALVACVVPLILSMLWRRTHQMILRYGECDLMWPTRDTCWIRYGCGSLSVGDTWLGESDLDGVVWHFRTRMRRNKHKNVGINFQALISCH